MELSRFSSILLLFALLCTGIFYHLERFPSEKSPEALLPEKKISIPAITASPSPPSLNATYACVMDADSGRILYKKSAHKKAAMASTTKIMTALLVLEKGKPDDIVTFSPYATSMPKVHLGAKSGSQYYLSDLLYSLMLESHNDTAVALAEHISGSVKSFAALMNRKAKKLGMKSTHFVTPNGLDADGHYSTASDMCKLAAYALKNKEFCKLVQTKSHSFSSITGTVSHTLTNLDAFLSYYEGALGIKTGFTGDAGYCFVGAAKRDDVTLVSCVLASGWPPNKTYKWLDTSRLMDLGFTNYQKTTLPVQNLSLAKIPVEDGKKDFVSCKQPDAVTTLTGSFDSLQIHYDLPEKLHAPIKEDTPIGSISFYINDNFFKKQLIFPTETIEKSYFSDTINLVLNFWLEIFDS